MTVVVESQTHWVLYEWPRRGHVLAWGTHVAAERARQLGFNQLVLTSDVLQMPEWGWHQTELSIHRFPYEDDGKLMASDRFRAALCRAAEGYAFLFRSGHAEERQVRALVTCHLGFNRSALVAARVLHELTGMRGTDIVGLIREKRPEALHREAFREWIETWGAETG